VSREFRIFWTCRELEEAGQAVTRRNKELETLTDKLAAEQERLTAAIKQVAI
jgi:hypothetical protein